MDKDPNWAKILDPYPNVFGSTTVSPTMNNQGFEHMVLAESLNNLNILSQDPDEKRYTGSH